MSRKSSREAAMQLLYQIDLGDANPSEAIESFYDNYEGKQFSSEEREYIEVCVMGTLETIKDIDALIEKHSKEWKLSRMAKVDLSIMRLAIYEMLKRNDVPGAVAVNEAIELAKKFGGEHSANFVNGVLGNIIKETE